MALDKALEHNSFQVVLLLRLSPLLPFALGNYLYGLSSTRLVPYIAASWLGMLPVRAQRGFRGQEFWLPLCAGPPDPAPVVEPQGTFAYVSAGNIGKEVLMEGGSAGIEWWQVGVGAAVTVLALGYIGRMAKKVRLLGGPDPLVPLSALEGTISCPLQPSQAVQEIEEAEEAAAAGGDAKAGSGPSGSDRPLP